MAVLRQRFSRPIPPRRGAIQSHIIGPFRGMNTSVPPQNLMPGETPYAENFVINNGVLESRSCVTSYSKTSIPGWSETSGTVQAYHQGYKIDGTRWDLILASGGTGFGAYSIDNGATWVNDSSTLSDIFNGGIPLATDWTQFFDPDSGENAIGSTSNTTPAIYRPLKTDSEWTILSDFASVESCAKCITSFDNRLIFFNTTSGATNFGNRVRWSVRGDPTDFTSIGAGFEDLTGLRGSGTALESEKDRIILFTDFEVWEGRPRRDAYAFDFDIIEKNKGCSWPGTLVSTPKGIIWLGKDFNFYMITGEQILPFTPDVQRYLQEVVTDANASTMQAQYDTTEGLYMLFFRRAGDPFSYSYAYSYAFFMRVQDICTNSDGTKLKGDWMLQNLVGSSGNPTKVRGYDTILPTVSYNYLTPTLFQLSQNWYYDTEQVPQGLPQIWTSSAVRGTKDPTQFEAVTNLLIDYSYEANSSNSTLRMRVLERSSHDTGWNISSTKSVDLEGTPNISSPPDPWEYGYTTGTAKMPTIKSAFIPMTPEASRYHQFMLYNKGIYGDLQGTDTKKSNPEAKLRIHNIHATIRPWSGRRPY